MFLSLSGPMSMPLPMSIFIKFIMNVNMGMDMQYCIPAASLSLSPSVLSLSPCVLLGGR